MNKKGISEIVSYVILIIIAVGLGVLVYAFLKNYVTPPDVGECLDVSVSLRDYVCDADAGKVLSLELVNKGNFKVDAIFLRIRDDTNRLKQLNKDKEIFSLMPDESVTRQYNLAATDGFGNPLLNITKNDNYTLEIQPSKRDEKGRFILCENALIKETIQCN